ncbi:MAG: phosphatase PAP2 family protein [bacterium]
MLKETNKIILQNRSFLVPFFLIWIGSFVQVCIHNKIYTHQILNEYHTNTGDIFFKYFTEMGGVIPFVILFIMLFFNYRASALIASTLALSSSISRICKEIFQAHRPIALFEKLDIHLPLVQGVDLHRSLSFPSGHTTTAFAVFLALAMLSKKIYIKVICLITALLAGYSRIYLSQHFLEDVVAGALIGVFSTVILSSLFINKTWGNSNLINSIKGV